MTPAMTGTWDMRYAGTTAVAWTPGAAPVDLDTLLFDGAGWDLQVARGVNAGGAIVGSGTYQGSARGFLLIPH